MYIKQSKQLKFKINKYYSLDILNQYPITLITRFFNDGFNHIHLFGTRKYIEKFKNRKSSGICFEIIELTIDSKSNLAYISEIWRDSTQEVTPEIDQLIENDAIIELCRINFIKYTVMSEDNLFHLLLAWEEFVNKEVPYILLYQDDQDWYDSLAFESQETMEKFIADHTQ
jgi:hypothetical protein